MAGLPVDKIKRCRLIIWILPLLLIFSCRQPLPVNGNQVENQIITANNLRRDFTNPDFLQSVLDEVNCADSAMLKKKIVLSDKYHSGDTTEILLIPFTPKGDNYKSSAYSDVAHRYILINPIYIRDFTLKYTLNDTSSFRPVLELMLLHEAGHFLLRKTGYFDVVSDRQGNGLGEQKSNSQPEYLTAVKKVEMSADSLAIDMVKRRLKPENHSCLDIALSIERVVPGMQFMMAGRRAIDNFGAPDEGFLHDPSNNHPNLELRITFMTYFLFPTEERKQMIDNYLYNRTVAAVHRQEFDPQIYQGKEKILPDQH